MYETMQNELKQSKRGLQLAAAPGPDTIVLEIALVELKPTQVIYNVAGQAGGIFVPGASTAGNVLAKGSVGIQMKITDGQTGEVLAEAADRRVDSSALLVDLQDFSPVGHAKREIRNWARELRELWDTPVTQKVEGPSAFKIIAW